MSQVADGDDQVRVWRRSYAVPPPPLTPDDPRYPGMDPRYAGMDPADLPLNRSRGKRLCLCMKGRTDEFALKH